MWPVLLIAAAGPAIRVEVIGEAVFGRPVVVEVEVANTFERPLILRELTAEAAGTTFAGVASPRPVAASILDKKAELAATIQEEVIGPQARLPSPPRWQWQGPKTLAMLRVLKRKERFSLRGSVTLGNSQGEPVRVRLHYSLLPDGVQLYQLGSQGVSSLVTSSSSGKRALTGWIARAEAKARFWRGPGVLVPAAEPQAWLAEGELGGLAERGPALFANALPEPELERLEVAQAQLEQVITPRPPPLSLAEARAQSGAGSGKNIYHDAFKAWFLEHGEQTFRVTHDAVEPLPGALVELISSLPETGSVEVLIFRGPAQDPDGLVALLHKHEISVRTRAEKGGGYAAFASVDAKSILDLVRVLASHGRRIIGREVH